ncbi:Dabb family protein [Salegentibacter sp. F188]|uniref:Dabb family protein n=1 Tax=Autumnicola patrickiae TaxID=3075591 RepID=A0ABU3E0S8_9FLAO|nr:Dabb family protein [Salegentibacter sp. F188]MDT0689589.1 Dabb family protein [Salegentibacter sp. F188]
MKNIKRIGQAILIVCLLSTILSCENSTEKQMRHIVVFKFKPTATDDQISKVTDTLEELENKIPGIVSFEHGINNSPEDKNQGFTHVYLFTFEDAKARDSYLPHPEHQKFGEMIGEMEIVEDVFVVDYSPVQK